MTNEEILEFTNELYKLTLLFPKKEPLRYKIRETALELLVDIIHWSKGDFSSPSKKLGSQIESELTVLKSFFQIAKEQNWVKNEEILELEKKYIRIEEAFQQFISQPSLTQSIFGQSFVPISEELAKIQAEKEGSRKSVSEEKPTVSLPPFGLEQQEGKIELEKRQKKVLKILQEKKEVRISQLDKDFPEVSRRTLLRDLEKLSLLGFVTRKGNGRGIYYRFQLKKIA